MIYEFRNNSKESIDRETAKEISLEEALELIKFFSTREENADIFIGFINPMLKLDTIQFFRNKKTIG